MNESGKKFIETLHTADKPSSRSCWIINYYYHYIIIMIYSVVSI